MRTIICAMLVVTSAVSIGAQRVPPSQDADVALIRREIETICQAFIDKDRKVLEETHGKEWRGFTPGNDHVIRGIDGYMNEATFGPNAQKGQGMVGYKISDFDVVFYGDTAVASFVLESDVVYGGQKGQQKLTILDVFHKEPRGWTQVASNTSLHSDEMMRQMSASRSMGDDEQKELLAAREAVWRAWFSGQTATLNKVLPAELITIEPDGSFGTLTVIRRDGDSLHDLRNGPSVRRQADDAQRRGDGSIRSSAGWPLGEHRLAADTGVAVAVVAASGDAATDRTPEQQQLEARSEQCRRALFKRPLLGRVHVEADQLHRR